MGTLRFFEEVVSFKIRRTFGFADYICGITKDRPASFFRGWDGLFSTQNPPLDRSIGGG